MLPVSGCAISAVSPPPVGALDGAAEAEASVEAGAADAAVVTDSTGETVVDPQPVTINANAASPLASPGTRAPRRELSLVGSPL